MFLIKSKKIPVKEVIVSQPHEEELKAITQNLYKQNLELAVKNKTLSLLRELYQISILTLDPQTLAGKFAETIQKAFEFELVAFFLFDKEKDILSPLKFIHSEKWRVARESLQNAPFDTFTLQSISQHPFFAELIATGMMKDTKNLKDIWAPVISKDILDELQKRANIKSSLAYPLTIDGRIIGVLLFSLNRNYDDLVQYERESIMSFINPISVALDKAFLYEKLQVANKDLADSNERQTILIHFITHQIKGFLAKSRNIFSFILEGDLGVISPELKNMATEGLESGTKGVSVVEDILNAANLKTGKVAYTMAEFDLKNLVTETFNELKTSAESRKLNYGLTIPDGKYLITGDAPQLKHVIKNLIDNSIKYTPQGSVCVSLVNTAGKIIFEVKDTGVGITPEDKAKLFTEGGRGKDSQKVNVDSTGFGLFIAKGIVEAHHGRIWAESEGADKGSSFKVELEGVR